MIEKVIIPSDINDLPKDIDKNLYEWNKGKCICLKLGSTCEVYMFHEEINNPNLELYGNSEKLTQAIKIVTKYPLSRANIINDAERLKYDLNTAMDVASFNASLARKSRLDPNDLEVKEHDEFIESIRSELTNIGILV